MKKVMTFFLLVTLTLSPTVLARESFSVTMKNSAPSEWANVEYQAAIDKNLVPESIQAYPQSNITRQQFSEIVVLMLEGYLGKEIPPPSADTFVDTKDTNVVKAYGASIINGVGDGRFEPDATITRQDLTSMMYSAIKANQYAQDYNFVFSHREKAFDDISEVSDYAKTPVNQLASWGFLNGVSSTIFAPQDTVTVEQAVIISYRIFDFIEELKIEDFKQIQNS